MRRTIIISFILSLFSLSLFAQDKVQEVLEKVLQEISELSIVEEKQDNKGAWSDSLLVQVNLSQTGLSNWASGGYNTIALNTFLYANLKYKDKNLDWFNRIQLEFGFLYSDDKPFMQKSVDRFYLESMWGYKAGNNLKYSAQFSFKSQFSDSYLYPVPAGIRPGTEPTKEEWMSARTLKSGFLSPAYTNVALGIAWTPAKWLTMNFAPLTGGFVIVSNKVLRKSYSMDLIKGSTDMYRAARFEFGAQFKMDAHIQLNEKVNYRTQLVLFSDYLNKPQNIRVNWDNRLDWKVAKYFAFSLTTNLIYDDKIKFATPKDPVERQRIQFRESIAFGFTYALPVQGSNAKK